MTIQLSIERPAGHLGNPPATVPAWRPLPAPPAANDAAVAAMATDVRLPRVALHDVRYAFDADDRVARVIAAAVAAVGAVTLLESVARLAALYA